MKLPEVKRTFTDIRCLSEGKTNKYEAKVDLPGLGVKWVGVFAEDVRSAQKMLEKVFGKGKVKTRPTKA